MQQNVTFSSGNIALIDKIDPEPGFFESVPGNIGGRSRSFIPAVKLLISNKLNQSVSINKVLDFTPDDLLKLFGFEDRISERSLYRVLERVGENQPVIIERFQHWIKHQKLVDSMQFMDFSSSYLEGSHGPLGKRGYSRDSQPGKLPFTFGISIGLNNIPTNDRAYSCVKNQSGGETRYVFFFSKTWSATRCRRRLINVREHEKKD